jgi:hypothetical protein
MKTRKCLALLPLLLTLAACESSRTLPDNKEYRCVGVLTDPADVNPNIVYEMSVRNAVVGLFFAPLFFPPVIVIAKEFKCPERLR